MGDPSCLSPRESHVLGGHPGVADDPVRPRDRLVGRTDVERSEIVLGGQFQAAAGVMQGRLEPAQDRVHPGALPFAAGPVHRVAYLSPQVPARVGTVQHLVVLADAALGLVKQLPDVIEDRGGEPTLLVRLEPERAD